MQRPPWYRDPLIGLSLALLLVALGLYLWFTRRSVAETPPLPLVLDAPPAGAEAALAALQLADPPPRDLAELTRRFKGLEPPAVNPDARPPQPQARDLFWVKNQTSNTNEQIAAILVHQSDSLNFWVEEGIEVEAEALQAAVERLEQHIFPTTRAFFGTEWQPGVDNDNRVNILHVEEIGGQGGTLAGGYFSAADEYVSAVNPFSNQREMFYLSLKQAPVGSQAYFEVIAHEMQHMIQWHTDHNENTWLDEGLSELSALVNGFESDRQAFFTQRPDTPLTGWTQEGEAALAHVGASLLFATYFWERFGAEATQTLVRRPENGVQGVAVALMEQNPEWTFDAFFLTWATANYLAGLEREQGIYTYDRLTLSPMALSAVVDKTPADALAAVHAYGVDYIAVNGESPVTLSFTGTQQVALLEADPYAGSAYWTTVPADRSDMTLTRAFDLRGLERATLIFWNWFEIEEGWDYGYVVVSTDGGRRWTPLPTTSSTTANPQGNSLGPGLTGRSGGGAEAVWVQETADLTPFAGQEILLRFEYITDDAVLGQGWAIDELAIPELDYTTSFEAGDEGWEAAGFVRHGNRLPPRFGLQAIYLPPAGPAQVELLTLNDQRQGVFRLQLSAETPQVVLVVANLTPVVSQRASYAYRLTP